MLNKLKHLSFFYIPGFVGSVILHGLEFLLVIFVFTGCENPQKTALVLPYFPQDKAGAVSLVCYTHNVTDDYIYQNDFSFLKNAGLCGTFGVNLAILLGQKDTSSESVFWKRLQEYKNAGCELAIYIRNSLVNTHSAEEIVDLAQKGREILLNRLGVRAETVRFESPLGSHPLRYDAAMEQAGFMVDTYDYYRTRREKTHEKWDCPEYYGIGASAEQDHLWIKFRMASGWEEESQEIVQKYQSLLIDDLKKRNIAIVTIGEMEHRRRDLVNLHFQHTEFGWEQKGISASGGIDGYLIKESDKIPLKQENLKSFCRPVYICAYPGNAQAMAVFSIDDINKEMYQVWYPAFKSNNLLATFFVIMQEPFSNDMARNFLEMQENGFEIGCHSYRHMIQGRGLGAYPDLFSEDCRKAVDVMKRFGFHGESYCFPGNYHTAVTRDAAHKFFHFLVANERSCMYPDKSLLTAELLRDFLLLRKENHVFMLHTPVSPGQDYLTALNPFLCWLATHRNEIANMTYSQSRAYFEERYGVEAWISPLSKRKLSINLKPKYKFEFTPVPLTVSIPLSPEEINHPVSVAVDGKAVQYSLQQEKGCLLVDALPGSEIIIDFGA